MKVAPPFRKLLSRLALDFADAEAAVGWMLDHHTARILEAQADPVARLAELIRDVYWSYDFHPGTKRYLGDSHGIEHLIGLYRAHADADAAGTPLRDDELAEHRSRIVGEAQKWRERYTVAGARRPSPG